ncbi:MAG: toll/interleukin-1 receptor domain-containing protein [Nitrospira sp.]
MSRIFISYRRDDSAGWTGRLADQLKTRFGSESIFIDIDTIEPGVDFTEALRKAVGSCDVLLAVIGPRWATVTDKTGTSRLHDASDWIRVEIAAALARKIRVIPVLVGGATMPSAEFLPDDLDGFAKRQAHELSDKRWTYDVEQLLKVLSSNVQDRGARLPHSDRTTPSSMSRPIVGVLLLIVIGGLVAIWPQT